MTTRTDTDLFLVDESARITRRRIIETAERFFREIGYQKTTVADIAKSLRMSPANVYRFFDSKKAINEAVVERVTREIQTAIEVIAAGDRVAAAERIAEMIRYLNRSCAERAKANPRLHEMVEAAVTESWDVCLAHAERVVAIFAGVVREGAANGEFSVSNAETAARCLYVSMMRYTHPMVVSQLPNTPAPALEAMIGFVLTALGVDAEGIAAATEAA